MITPPFLMFIDVESIGLHGEGFAIAWIVLDEHSVEVDARLLSCPRATAAGDEADRQWVDANVPSLVATHTDPPEVRKAFWEQWLLWRGKGAWMVADCPWPVEARFLMACVAESGPGAANEAPYPLLDVSTLVAAVGHDPRPVWPPRVSDATGRLRDGVLTEAGPDASGVVDDLKSLHDPLADARHSARRWRECLLLLTHSGQFQS